MEIEQPALQEINDLASDQVFTEAVTELGDEVVNELSLHSCAQLAMVVTPNGIVLRSDAPFTLRRFRARLQVNFTPQYRYEQLWGEGPCLTRCDTMGERKPLRTYVNRFEDQQYLATLDPTALPLDAEKVKNETERYVLETLIREHNLWRCMYTNCSKEEKRKVKALIAELRPQYAEREARFRLGYAELHQRRTCDLDALTEREVVARYEWTLLGPNVLPRFFNGTCPGLTVENRTLQPLYAGGNVVTRTLWPYEPPFAAVTTRTTQGLHCT